MPDKVRVRFAPSPTGPLHIGGVRTALYNYLFAKKNKGDFILRIEDTDQTRKVKGAEEYIVESLNWLNIAFDEGPEKGEFGPYRQSERKELYHKHIEKLIQKGFAYYAFDTPESLAKHREDHEAKGKTFTYSTHNRLLLDNSLSLSEDETKGKLNSNTPYVVRFKMPAGEQLILKDEIRGAIEINTDTLDDKILMKSDGMPTYHLANVVDDHLMKISHVIRGEEWISSLSLHVLLYQAFGWKTPKFAHLPLILKPTGKGKLSKRDGEKGGFPVFPLNWKSPEKDEITSGYREEGYFPEAVVNMLAFLGWNPGTEQEIFSLKELIKAFDLKRVHKSGAKFDPEKTKWFQHQYLQKKPGAELAKDFEKLLQSKDARVSFDYVEKVVSILKERATFISDFWEQGSFFFVAPKEYDEKAMKKIKKEETLEILDSICNLLEDRNDFSEESLKNDIREWINSRDFGFGKVMQPLRMAMAGALKGPDLFLIMGMLGKKESIARIKTLENQL